MSSTHISQGSSSSPLQSWTVQLPSKAIPVQQQPELLHPSIPLPINPHLVGEKRSDSTCPHQTPSQRQHYIPAKGIVSWIWGKDGKSVDRSGFARVLLCPIRLVYCPSGLAPKYHLTYHPLRTQRSSLALMAGGKMSTIDGFPYISTDNPKAPCLSPLSSTRLLQTDCSSHEMENPIQHMVQFATCSPPLAAEEFYTSPELLLQQQSKRKRFQNTMVVLHRSGLLEITLKTKELIHQNHVTQIELDRLKQQTQLFMEAIKSNAPQAWAELEASLTGSDKADSSLEASPTYPNM